MIIIWFMCSALLGLGIFCIIANSMRYPLLASRYTVTVIGRKGMNTIGGIKVLVMNITQKLSKYIRLNEYNKERLSAVLKSADIFVSPENYIAYAIVTSGIVLALIPVALIIFPPIAIAALLLAVAIFFKEYRSAFNAHEKKKKQLEAELLRFTSTIKESLKKSRDILSILDTYRKAENTALSKELSITITDMRTGNYEIALSRLSSRVNSGLLNDVVRGLLGTLRGDDQTKYFETVVDKMKELEIQRLRKEVMKRPGKIKIFSFLMVACFMLLYLVVMGIEILNSFGKLF